jgi:hypothetical protein
MKSKMKDLMKIVGATALTLTLAVSAFAGANILAFAAATEPEILPVTDDIKDAYIVDEVPQDDYQEPVLTVIKDENLDENGNPYPTGIPSEDAMAYEEAAKIGARYIWEMYGVNIDGKTVLMSYSAPPYSSRAYWHGTVGNSAEDVNPPVPSREELAEFAANAGEGDTTGTLPEKYSRKALYDFSVDAVTGEWVSIHPWLDIPEPTDLGEGKSYTVSPVEMENMQYTAPANVDGYAEAAREFAQKHFKHTTVVSVEFHMITLNHGDREQTKEHAKAYRDAYEAGRDKPFAFTLYEKGRQITFNVTDDTGRVAWVSMNMDTKQVVILDTSDSDFIPGYNFESERGVG